MLLIIFDIGLVAGGGVSCTAHNKRRTPHSLHHHHLAMLLPPHCLARPLACAQWAGHHQLVSLFPSSTSYSAVAAYLVVAETYLDTIWDETLASVAKIPWDDELEIYITKERVSTGDRLVSKFRKSTQESVAEWTGDDEKGLVLANIGFAYVTLGLLLAKQLLESGHDQWKSVVDLYKKALAVAKLGTLKFGKAGFAVLNTVADVLLQLLVVAKQSYTARTTSTVSASGMLSRAAIYAATQLGSLQQTLPPNAVVVDYFEALVRYARAYAAYYTAIDHYDQKKIGHALGLLQLGIIALQGRNHVVNELSLSLSKPKSKLLELRRDRKNDKVVRKLRPVISKKIEAFVPIDTQELLDLILLLQQSYTKENETLAFQLVVDWREIEDNAQWPLGKPIPLLGLPEYTPGKQKNVNTALLYSGQGAYY